MQLLVLLIIVAFSAEDAAPQNTGAVVHEHLLQELSNLGAAPLAQESEFLKNHVMQDGTDFAARVQVFEEFLARHPFTENHGTNLSSHIAYGTADRARMARFAAAFAAAAIRLYWENPAQAEESSLSQPLLLLERIFIAADETVNMAVGEGINDALKDKPVKLRAYMTMEASTPEQYARALQCCISLGVFKGARPAAAWLEVPERTAGFIDGTGVWLFDNGVLPEAHVACLQNIFKNIPRAMHNVCALFVPEVIPFSAAASPLRLPGGALDIPVVPEEMMRDMSVMPPYVALPPLPEFMALALEQAMKAVVAVNLPRRPDIIQRTAAIMRAAIALPDTPVAQMAPPEVMMGTPDILLAYLGALWLANSEALLEAAIAAAEQGNPAPLYMLLLVADLFSIQGDTTLLFRATPMGTLSASETALRRVFFTPQVSYVNGIAVGGRLWQYDMSGIAALP